MSPIVLFRAIASLLLFLAVALPLPDLALGQHLAPDLAQMTPEVRERLVRASVDPLLAPWQIQLMRGLARSDEPSSLEPIDPIDRAADSQHSAIAVEGTWAELAIGARAGHSAIYDPVRDRIVVFGGVDGTYSNDVWVLALTGVPTWTKLTPAGAAPNARAWQSTIYDPVRDRVVMFGGYRGTGSQYFNDVWTLSLSGSTGWALLTPTGTLPEARYRHSAIYDPARDRILVFGGLRNNGRDNELWSLSLAGTSAWTLVTPTGVPPSARSAQSAIYDPVRDRMLLFGGADSVVRNDVWALTLAGGPAWSELMPAGPPPGARVAHSAIYDQVRDRMLVLGGLDGSGAVSGLHNDVWSLSLAASPAWTELTPAGTPPNARMDHFGIYDPVRDRMVVFGGYDGFARNDLWMLDLGAPAWILVDAPPAVRAYHSAVHDPVRDRMVVFGGTNGFPNLGDVWALSPGTTPAWSELLSIGPPGERYAHSAIYDPVRDRMVVFGGVGTGYLNDVWALSLGATPYWAQLTPTGGAPSPRNFHSAIYDPLRDRMVVFGGVSSGGFLNDIWALSLGDSPSWTELTPTGTPPSGRRRHSAIYDPIRDRMVVFAGVGSSGLQNDVWTFALEGSPAWTKLTPAGTPPGVRSGHSAIYEPVRDRMVIFGGVVALQNDVWALSLSATSAWAAVTPAGALPSPRNGHTAIYDPLRDRMVAFGGFVVSEGGGGNYHNGLWALNWDSPVPALISLMNVTTQSGCVTLTWFSLDELDSRSRVERRTLLDNWVRLGFVSPDGTGRLTFEDRSVAAGARYGYRLTYTVGSIEVSTPEVWVDVPAHTPFSLDGARPSPAVGDLMISFSLPGAEVARLEMFDLAGRRVLSREVGYLGAGAQALNLSMGSHFPPGVYVLRLTQGKRAATARAVLVR